MVTNRSGSLFKFHLTEIFLDILNYVTKSTHCYLNLLYPIHGANYKMYIEKNRVGAKRGAIFPGVDQNLTWQITYPKIALTCIVSSIENKAKSICLYFRSKIAPRNFPLVGRKRILYISCPKRNFCGYNRGSRLTLRINTINLRHYFKYQK